MAAVCIFFLFWGFECKTKRERAHTEADKDKNQDLREQENEPNTASRMRDVKKIKK